MGNAERDIYIHTDAKRKKRQDIAKKSGWIEYIVGMFVRNGSKKKR